MVLAADIVLERMNQTGQQARAKHVHVAAQGIRQDGQCVQVRPAFVLRNQCLSLRLVQPQAGEDPARVADLVVNGIERIGAERSARGVAGIWSTPKRRPTSSIRSTSRFKSTRQLGMVKVHSPGSCRTIPIRAG